MSLLKSHLPAFPLSSPLSPGLGGQVLSSDQSWRTGRGPPGGREHVAGAGSGWRWGALGGSPAWELGLHLCSRLPELTQVGPGSAVRSSGPRGDVGTSPFISVWRQPPPAAPQPHSKCVATPRKPPFPTVNTSQPQGPQLLGTLDLRFCSGHSC